MHYLATEIVKASTLFYASGKLEWKREERWSVMGHVPKFPLARAGKLGNVRVGMAVG
jgi:hypothetical protein